MALSLGQTGTADSVDAEYFNWESADQRFLVHMHLDAIDGLTRDAFESSRQQPPKEIGGLLLGQVGRGERPVVWIERYQRIEIEHRDGPGFTLGDADYAAFEQAARSFAEGEELVIVGFYRTHLRNGLQMDPSDRELADRYFRDSEDLLLLLRPEEIKPENKLRIIGKFFGRGGPLSGFTDLQVLGPAFQLKGRITSALPPAPSVADDESEERTGKTTAAPPEPAAAAPVPPPAAPPAARRLVPDFQPAIEPGRPREFTVTRSEPEIDAPGFFHKRWPLLAALLLVAIVGAVVWQQTARRSPPSAAQTAAAPVRPLGLYVDPSGRTWRVSWNQSATALQGARDVKLFIRDGEEQVRVISGQELQSGSFDYQPKGLDVTFRLEATDSTGRLSAESFRVLTPKAAEPAQVEAPAAGPATLSPKPPDGTTPPKAMHRVAPVVPSSIRPRIKGSIPLDVRVAVDARGHVTSAAPVSRPRTSLERFLAQRALTAARQWRFEPARRDGKAVPGVEIIHFVFDR